MGKGKIRRIEDVERLLPPRIRIEPKPGDNPLKRPYPQHSKDMEILGEMLAEINKDPPQYKFVNRDARVKMTPHGVLFFHALDIQKLILSKNNFVRGSPFCVYVEAECQGMVKCSDPVYSIDFKKVRIDHSIHMWLELSDIALEEKNDFLIHIYAFQDPESHYLIGSQVIHLYEFVREVHGISSVQMINELSFHVGKLTFEFAWAYGSFGYGFSSQLRNNKSGVLQTVCHSMFPRIKLKPDDLLDNQLNVRIPKKLRLITLNSLLVRKGPNKKNPLENNWKGEASKSKTREPKAGEDFKAKTVVFRRVKFSRGTPVHVSLNLDIHQKFMESDFNTAYGEFICLRNRRDRLSWLTRLTDGRLRDRVEYDVGELFIPHKTMDEARRAMTVKRPLGCPPAYLDYTDPNRNTDCKPIHPTFDNVEEEDWKFIHEKLGSAPRFSGYLAYIFGYEKPPPVDENLKNFEFKVDPKAANEAGQSVKDNTSWIKKIWMQISGCCAKMMTFFTCINDFLFPALERAQKEKLPEISLTMPSPEHSTMDFHSLITQQQVFAKQTELEKTRRRVTQYVQMTRKRRDPDKNPNDFQDFVIPSKAFIGEVRNVGEQKGASSNVMDEHARKTSVPERKHHHHKKHKKVSF